MAFSLGYPFFLVFCAWMFLFLPLGYFFPFLSIFSRSFIFRFIYIYIYLCFCLVLFVFSFSRVFPFCVLIFSPG